MQFHIGQIITNTQPLYANASVWCNNNNAHIVDLGDGTSRIEEVKQPPQEEKDTQRIQAIQTRLNELDIKLIRSTIEIQEGTATEETNIYRTTYLDEKAELHTELEQIKARSV